MRESVQGLTCCCLGASFIVLFIFRKTNPDLESAPGFSFRWIPWWPATNCRITLCASHSNLTILIYEIVLFSHWSFRRVDTNPPFHRLGALLFGRLSDLSIMAILASPLNCLNINSFLIVCVRSFLLLVRATPKYLYFLAYSPLPFHIVLHSSLLSSI